VALSSQSLSAEHGQYTVYGGCDGGGVIACICGCAQSSSRTTNAHSPLLDNQSPQLVSATHSHHSTQHAHTHARTDSVVAVVAAVVIVAVALLPADDAAVVGVLLAAAVVGAAVPCAVVAGVLAAVLPAVVAVVVAVCVLVAVVVAVVAVVVVVVVVGVGVVLVAIDAATVPYSACQDAKLDKCSYSKVSARVEHVRYTSTCDVPLSNQRAGCECSGPRRHCQCECCRGIVAVVHHA
jgi:hypothetical protein